MEQTSEADAKVGSMVEAILNEVKARGDGLTESDW